LFSFSAFISRLLIFAIDFRFSFDYFRHIAARRRRFLFTIFHAFRCRRRDAAVIVTVPLSARYTTPLLTRNIACRLFTDIHISLKMFLADTEA